MTSLGPGRTVWLASYPKSGNTWVRAIVTALGVHPHLFAVNQLSSGAQPFGVGDALPRLGLDARWLSRHEIDRLRTALVTLTGSADPDPDPSASDDALGSAPRLRKTHEMWRPGEPGAEPFPLAGTRAAILLVRDPRDVACSYAPFFGRDLDAAVEALGSEPPHARTSPAVLHTAQPWGSWSSHALSWLDPAVPFPVHVVRYEDLLDDAVGALLPVFRAVGLECTADELQAAVDQARFDRLRDQEARDGFREVSPMTRSFFRSGRAGGWRDELTAAHVAAIEADHAATMTRFGYALTTDPAERAALGEARASRRRRGDRPWYDVPEHLGLDITMGTVPADLPDAVRPNVWLQTTATATRVDFGPGRALLVEDGRRVTVQWDARPDDDADEAAADLAWLAEGWAVTLASLQRGHLSLHASTVEITHAHGTEVVAVAGRQGAGKSTTSMALRGRGHRLLIDDTTILELRGDGAWTTPYARNVHLLPDAAAALGVDFDALPRLAGRHGKSAFRPEEPPLAPRRIDRVVVLTSPPSADTVDVRECRGTERVTALRGQVSRRGIAPLVLGQQRFFDQLVRLAATTRVQVVRRPPDTWTLDAVLDAIESGHRVEEKGRAPHGAGASR